MAEFRGNTLPEYKSDGSSEKKDKKKKDSKKESPFRLPPLARIERDGRTEKTEEVSAMDKLLADLAIKKEERERAKEKAERPTEAETKEPKEPSEKPAEEAEGSVEKPVEEPAEAAESTTREKVNEADDEEAAEELPIHAEELPPSRISLGEGILDLGRDDETVIELRRIRPAEAHAESEAESAAEADTAVPAAEASQDDEPEDDSVPQQTSEPAAPPPGNTLPPTPNAAPHSPDLPPPPPPFNPNLPPPGPPSQPNPNSVPNAPPVNPNANPNLLLDPDVVPDPSQYVTRQELEDEIYYARKRGVQNGVAAGLFAGGLYEHFKHRRREKKAEKRFKQQGKQLKQAREDLTFANREKDRRQAEQAQRKAETNARLAAAKRQSAETATVPLRRETAERPRHSFEYRTLVPAAQPEAVRAPVRSVETDKKPEKLMAPTPERVAAEGIEQQLAVAEGHRLETSAWHSIEVDARTGKAVEAPAFEYGQEFYRERAPETRLEGGQTQDTPVSGAAADEPQSAAEPTASLPPVDLPSASMQGPPSSVRQTTVKAAPPSGSAKPAPLWPLLVALAVVIVCLILVLR